MIEYKPNRLRKSLNLSVLSKPKNEKERRQNKETLRLAEEMRRQEELQLSTVTVIDKADLSTSIDFYDYYQDYVDSYYKKDKRHVTRALKLFRDFLGTCNKYRCYTKRLPFESISRQMIEGYVAFLISRFKGEGPHSTYARFKKVFRCAALDGVITRNPCQAVTIPSYLGQLTKDTLTLDELKTLMATHYKGENDEIKRAFLFCAFTGMRGCDVRALTYKNISFTDNILQFKQRKTENSSPNSVVTQPLTAFHLELIGPPSADRDALVFNLPSDTTCNAHLKLWVAEAKISKHITWHCARHSFGTNLCENNANSFTVKELMGLSSMKYTTVYVHVRDKAKKEAMESLSGIMPS